MDRVVALQLERGCGMASATGQTEEDGVGFGCCRGLENVTFSTRVGWQWRLVSMSQEPRERG